MYEFRLYYQIMSHSGGHGKEGGILGIHELSEASSPFWNFLGFLVLAILAPFGLAEEAPSSGH